MLLFRSVSAECKYLCVPKVLANSLLYPGYIQTQDVSAKHIAKSQHMYSSTTQLHTETYLELRTDAPV